MKPVILDKDHDRPVYEVLPDGTVRTRPLDVSSLLAGPKLSEWELHVGPLHPGTGTPQAVHGHRSAATGGAVTPPWTEPEAEPEYPETLKPAVASSYTPFETVAEIEAWARQQYPHITWQLDHGHPELMNMIVGEFHRLAQRYPLVAADMKFFIVEDLNSIYTWARSYWSSTTGNGLRFNTHMFAQDASGLRGREVVVDLRGKAREMYEVGWHPVGTVEDIMAHEFGHQVDYWIRRKLENYSVAPFYTGMETGIAKNLLYEWHDLHKRGRRSVSEYATKNEREMFAETFSEIEAWEANRNLRTTLSAPAEHLRLILNGIKDPEKLWSRVAGPDHPRPAAPMAFFSRGGQTDYSGRAAAYRTLSKAMRSLGFGKLADELLGRAEGK